MTACNLRKPIIGQRIKAGMVNRGLSISQFARMINCDRSNVYDIFQRRSIDSDLLRLISKALGRNYLLEMGRDLEEEMSD